MPEEFSTKEELYAVIHEFDDQVRSLYMMLLDINIDKVLEWNLSPKEYGLLIKYQGYLGMLVDRYNEIDRNLACQAQREEL